VDWFEVDKDGLGKLVEDRPKAFVIYELVQNAWDEQCRSVDVSLEPIEGLPKVRLTVVDDNPDGFADLTHAYRMFAESRKKGNPEQRGRFNVGEKLFLALCDEAKIVSTTGAVVFERDGSRRRGRERTTTGTRIEATLGMTRAELEQVAVDVRRLLPPPGVRTTFNGEVLAHRTPVASFEATLPTVVADESGVLRKSARKTRVDVYEVPPGEEAHVYELGIPVVETRDRFHVDVRQKVPQNQDRDNVTPAYLRQLRTEVLNATYHLVRTEADAAQPWVRNALEDERVDAQAVRAVVSASFGAKALAYDPSDPEASSTAVAAGYRVVHGGTFSAAQWESIRRAEALKPAGAVFATGRPYSDDPNAPKARLVPESEYSRGMRDVVALTKELSRRFLGHGCSVRIVESGNAFAACHIGKNVPNFTEFHFNLQALGRRWFDLDQNLAAVIAMIGHKFAHDAASNHLDAAFYQSLERFAGFVTELMRREPAVFHASVADSAHLH
jgi:hypothetical protein